MRPETLTSADPSSLSQTQQALLKFVDNWTSDEFVEFVTDCADIVDGAGIEIGSALAERCETVSLNFHFVIRPLIRACRCSRGPFGLNNVSGLLYRLLGSK